MLSKSDFRNYKECPCLLWLKKRRPDLLPADLDKGLQHVFAEGRKVDAEAQKLFPGGVVVEGFVLDGWERTKKMLRDEPEVLFQPTVVAGQYHARADILTRNRREGAWDIREVKSSTKVKEEHITDLAFQRLCFVGAKVPVARTYLVHLNNRYVRNGAIDPKKLFTSEDITAEVAEACLLVRREMTKALAVTLWDKKPGKMNVDACVEPATCEYLGYYLKELPQKLRETLEQERAVPTPPNPPIIRIDKAGIRKELRVLKYPYQFLDYETFSPAIPLFDGYRPYQRVTFQYSLVLKESAKSKYVRADYLAQEAVDPMPKLAAHLREHSLKGGTFFAWNASFEKGCNTEMGNRDEKYARFFDDVNGRMFDPMLLFRKSRGLYSHSDMGGSASLKKVQPVLVPDLSYKTLAIQEGGTASESWPVLTNPDTPAPVRKKLYADMLEYCGLDTMAMARIVEHLETVSKE